MQTSEESNRGAVVRLLIFSGREDPEWPLEPDQARELSSRLEESRGEPVRAPTPGGLGYRGFLLRGLRSIGAPADVVTVYRGVISEDPGGKAEHWRDSGGIEEALLAQARDHGHGELLSAMGAEGAEGAI